MQTGLMALLGLASLFIGWILTFVLPELRYVAWVILILGAILIIVAFVIDYRRVGRAIVSRRGRFGTGATIMVSVFIGIILLANAISYANYTRFDTTGFAQYTLTSQTKEVLSELESPVEVIMFLVPTDEYSIGSYATSLMNEYENFTNQLNVKTIDPDQRPEEARKYGITEYQSVVFIGEYGYRLVDPLEIYIAAEHAFTSAILEVTGTVQKVVYFVTGHGEVDIYDTSSKGYSTAREGLRDNLYKTAPIDLLTTRSVPENAAALVVAAPQESFSSTEIDIIQEYLERDGRLMLMVNPASAENFEQLLAPWGVEVEQGFIWEGGTQFAAPNRDSPLVERTGNAFGFSSLYFPGATSISIPLEGYMPTLVGTEEDPQLIWINEEREMIITLSSLAVTSEDSWLENSDSSTEPEFDEGVDVQGPHNLSFFILETIIEESDEKLVATPYGARLIVMGDSDFATNNHFRNGNNSDLFLNSIEYLTAGTELISIDQKFLQTRRLIISEEKTRFINISSIGLLPLLLLVAGAVVWWRRR